MGLLLLPRLLPLLLLLVLPLRGVQVVKGPEGVVRQQQEEAVRKREVRQDGSREEPTPTTTHPVTSWEETWVDLVMTLSRVMAGMVQPHWARVVPLDWQRTMAFVTSVVEGADIINQPLRAAAVGAAALSLPLLVQVSKVVLETLVKLMDDTMFVFTGHGLARSASLDHDLLEDVADLLLQLLNTATRYLG